MKQGKPYPSSILQIFLIFLLGLILSTPIIFFGEQMKSIYPNINDQDINNITGLIFVVIIYFLFRLVNKRQNNPIKHRVEIPHDRKLFAYAILFITALQIGIAPLIITSIKQLFTLSTHQENYSILGLLSILLFAPIIEELIFRGIILDSFLQTRKKNNAILLSALIFAIIHVHPTLLITAFILGILYGCIYYKTRNIGFTMILHAIANILAISINHIKNLLISELNCNSFLFYGKYTYIITPISIVLIVLTIRYFNTELSKSKQLSSPTL